MDVKPDAKRLRRECAQRKLMAMKGDGRGDVKHTPDPRPDQPKQNISEVNAGIHTLQDETPADIRPLIVQLHPLEESFINAHPLPSPPIVEETKGTEKMARRDTFSDETLHKTHEKACEN